MACEVVILTIVFELLGGPDLVRCMMVCKQWRSVAEDDYYWISLCTKRWPSACKQLIGNLTNSHRELFGKCYRSPNHARKPLPPNKLCFGDLEFYVHIMSHNDSTRTIFPERVVPTKLVWSKIVSGKDFTNNSSDVFKMVLPVDPILPVRIAEGEIVSVSIFVSWKDSNKMARLLRNAYADPLFSVEVRECRALAFGEPEFCHRFLPHIWATISLLFVPPSSFSDPNDIGVIPVHYSEFKYHKNGSIDVFEIEMEFSTAGVVFTS